MNQRSDTERAPSLYDDPRFYDHTFRRYRPDLDFYLQTARHSGGPVLELGVGTGRIALALAQEGIDVVGVDRSAGMLARATERIAKRPRRIRERIELCRGDMRELRLERRFPLVIAPFNAFQHLYEDDDVESTLSTCHAHLTRGGRLAFDVLVPDPQALARDPDRFYKCRPTIHPRDGRRYAYSEAFAYDQARQIQTITMRFTDPDDPDRVFFSRLTQRQFFPRELAGILRCNAFSVVSHDGGFLREPIDEFAESQVVVARALRD